MSMHKKAYPPTRSATTRSRFAAAAAAGLAASLWFADSTPGSAARAQETMAQPRAAIGGESADLAAPRGAYELLTPENCAVALIDYQPQMFFGVQSHDRQAIINNVVGLAKAAKLFEVPVVLSTVETKSFSGYTIPALREVLADEPAVERTTMNSWEDPDFVRAIEETGKKKLVLAGLWTEVCTVFPTLDALEAGYEVYVVTDACGATSDEAHDMAIRRVVQAGAVPVTWQQVMLEWQRDWANAETYDGVTKIVVEHSGAYGIGIDFAKTMIHGQEPETGKNDGQ